MAYRQTISFTDPQSIYIQREAEKLGITFSDMVRRIIDQWRTNQRQTAELVESGKPLTHFAYEWADSGVRVMRTTATTKKEGNAN